MDRLIEVKVRGSYLTKDSNYAGVQGEGNAGNLRIEFDEGWDSFARTVTFWNARGETPVERILTTDLLEDGAANPRIYLCPIPGEAMTEAGEMEFVVDGWLDGVRQRTVTGRLQVVPAPSGRQGEAAVTPSQAEQLQVQIDAMLGNVQAAQRRAEEAQDGAEQAEANAREAEARAAAVVVNSPYIDKNTGTWMVWDLAAGAYRDTGIAAECDPAVWIGSEPPPDDTYSIWLNPEGVGEESEEPTDAKYFDIDADGILSLKEAYRGHPTANTYPYAVSDNDEGVDGSLIHELPEKIVIPEAIGFTAVRGFQPGMFFYNFRVKEIVLPDGIDELPAYFARYAINLHTLRNTEQITKLGASAIGYSRVEKLLLPNLTEAADAALSGAYFLQIADIGNNLTELPYRFFAQDVLLSNVRGGGKVTKIGKQAFWLNYKLRKLPMLDHVTDIGEEAFYVSRVMHDWSKIATKGVRSTPVSHNTDFWTGAAFTPCENPLGSLLAQKGYWWSNEKYGTSGLTYVQCCSVFSSIHVHSALSGNTYDSPLEFVEEITGKVDSTGAALTSYVPSDIERQERYLEALGYDVERVAVNQTKANLETLYQALADGAYLILEISTSGNVNRGHVLVAYGINELGELMLADSSYLHNPYHPNGGVDRDLFCYALPYQNFTGPNSAALIVKNKA